MTSSLFRKEALEHRKDRLYGEVILLQPLSLTILVATVAFICIMILTILFWGTYARKEKVSGYIVPDKGIVKIYAPQQGTISKVHIREGDDVTEGNPLVTLLSERSMQGGSDIDTMLLQEIDNSQHYQLERIQDEKSLLVSGTSQLHTQISGLKQELDQIEKSLKNQVDRVHILELRHAGIKKLLDSKNISQTDYQKVYDELLAQKQQHQELLRNKVSRQNALAQTQSELEQLPIKVKSQITEIDNKISELKQRAAEIKGRKTFEIRSPIIGTVTALQAKEGQREGQMTNMNMPLLAIIPKDAVMQVDLFIPTRAIGFISQGQTVRIRYDAFPHRRFGAYEGTVAVISKHVLLPSEFPFPLESKAPVYRVTVNLKDQYVKAYGKQFPLQAGMSLEADIILDKQTLMKWIVDPIVSLKGRF